MVLLTLKDTGAEIGEISEDDFDFLVAQLEEESEEDTDYYVDQATIELLVRAGAGAHLVEMLQEAVGDSEGVDISWSRS